MKLNNFYVDNAFVLNDFENYVQLYKRAGADVIDYLQQVYLDKLIGEIGAYRTIYLASLGTASCVYSISDVVLNDKVVTSPAFIGKDVLTIISEWDKISIDDRMDALFKTGYFLNISFSQGEERVIDYPAVDLELFTKDDVRLIRGVDYEISSGNLFFLRQQMPETCMASGISFDRNVIGEMFPGLFSIENIKANLSLTEYVEMFQKMLRAALSGPTAKGLTDAMTDIFGDKANIYDKYSRDAIQRERWQSFAESPFDFIAEFPIDVNNDILKAATEYLRVMKPPETNYLILLVSSVSELYDVANEAEDSGFMRVFFSALESYVGLEMLSYYNDEDTNKTNNSAYSAYEDSYTEISADSGYHPSEEDVSKIIIYDNAGNMVEEVY